MTKILIDRVVVEQGLEALLAVKNHGWDEDTHAGRALITALKAALAEPTTENSSEVEPVQEPVAVLLEYENGERELRFKNNGWDAKETPLYTAPQRKPLSGIQVERLLEQVIGSLPVARNLIRAVERAHKIGGEG